MFLPYARYILPIDVTFSVSRPSCEVRVLGQGSWSSHGHLTCQTTDHKTSNYICHIYCRAIQPRVKWQYRIQYHIHMVV